MAFFSGVSNQQKPSRILHGYILTRLVKEGEYNVVDKNAVFFEKIKYAAHPYACLGIERNLEVTEDVVTGGYYVGNVRSMGKKLLK